MAEKKRGQPKSKSKTIKKIAGLKKEIAQLKAIKARLDKAGVKIKPLGKKPGDTINAAGTKADNAFLRTYKDRLAKLQRRLASLTGGSIGRTEAKDMRPSPAQSKEKGSKKGGKDDIDDAGPVGQEARRDKRNDNKQKDTDKRAAPLPKTKDKKTGPSKSDIMGGKDGPKGPLGGELDKQKKKKKRSMMGTNRFGAGKGRYGDNLRTGNYYGQR